MSLHELVKTCNFCSNACTQKNIRDQITEGLLDADTVEDLLQETNFTLATAVHKCQAQEAAKKQRAKLRNPESIAAFRKPQNQKSYSSTSTCQGCGAVSHPAGRTQYPAYSQMCFNCQKVGHFAKVCWSKPSRQHTPFTNTEQRTPHAGHHSLSAITDDPTHPTLDNIQHVASSEPAPLVNLDVISANGSCNTKALPDSGADISAAGKAILSTLNQWINTLLLQQSSPKQSMEPRCFH